MVTTMAFDEAMALYIEYINGDRSNFTEATIDNLLIALDAAPLPYVNEDD